MALPDAGNIVPNTARLRIFCGDFEDVETRYIASLGGFGFLEFP
jgi:hypothetical protein